MNEVLTHLDRLIAFDTVSAKPNAAMVDYLQTVCTAQGAVTTRMPSPQDGKTGLIARFGPDAEGGIVLSSHCDVVPTDGQNWTRPDFRLTREGDRLYGRGTTDMKGFLACMLAAGKTAGQTKLRRPLTLVFSYDEEIGCVGIQEMASHLPSQLNAPRLCIVGEPTEMQIATGHKGKAALRATFVGQAGHSALAPHFVNALHMAADFMSDLRALQRRYAKDGAKDPAYDVPYTTFHVGKLNGGTALNIVPDRAEMVFEYRHLAADDPAQILQDIREAARTAAAPYQTQYPDAGIAVEQYNSYPGLDVPAGADAVTFAKSLVPDAQTSKVAFGTEAGVFTALGIPTLVCGPGSMAGQGHKADEFVTLDQLNQCTAMLDRAIAALAA